MWFGILNVDKPVGATSRQVVDQVARLARTKKVGHAGTLDPMASGVLVLCLERATRLVPYLHQQPKQYRAEFLLGRRSDTDDATGCVEPTVPAPAPIGQRRVEEALSRFLGLIEQVPPQFSAVHVRGQRAYQRARRGESVALAPKRVEIRKLAILDYRFPRLDLEIDCSSGTYIRAIARDLGELLGCGALMSRLRRTQVGPCRLEDAVTLEQLQRDGISRHLVPARCAVSHLPTYTCSNDQLDCVRVGRPVSIAHDHLADDSALPFEGGQDSPSNPVPVALLTPDGDLAAIAEWMAARDEMAPRQVFLSERHG